MQLVPMVPAEETTDQLRHPGRRTKKNPSVPREELEPCHRKQLGPWRSRP